MDSEFPGVIELNVSGTHFRTLLSTLTKYEDSELAAMFTGRKPVYKDTDGRYFIECDPTAFSSILHFLLYDELPYQDPNNGFSRGFGRGFGRGEGLFGRFDTLNARNIELLYKDSMNLGLKSLTESLSMFQPIFINSKMDEYRQTIRGYDKTMAAILDIVPSETLFHKTEIIIRIKQDLQTIEEEKCCEHECKTLLQSNPSFNGQHSIRNINAVVKVPFEVNPTILSAFAIDFQKRGYIVQGELAMCGFECKKEMKQSKYVVFGTIRRNCCTEELYLLHFRWELESHVVAHTGLFGTKTATFGQAQQNTGFAFGHAQQKNGFSFGQAQQNISAFGQAQQNTGSFGQAKQNIGSFGQAQQNTSFSFGGKEQEHHSNTGSFGGGLQSGFGFGASQQRDYESGFGTSQPAAGFGFTQQQTPITTGSLGYGGESQQSGLFGQSNVFAKSSGPPQHFQQQSLFNKTSTQQGPSLFGSSAFNNQQSNASAGKSVFGGNQQSLFGQNVQQKGSSGSFSFGAIKTQVGSQKTQSDESSFGKWPPSKDQHVFGGKPTFQSSFGSPQQTTVTVSSESSDKSSADD